MLSPSEKKQIDSDLLHIYSRSERRLSLSELEDKLPLREVDDATYYALLDTQEQKQSVVERVSLENTKLQSSRSIYTTFYEQAAMRANDSVPTILVVTASARDPYEVIAFYEGVFRQLGAKVEWLPLTPSYQQAAAYQRTGLAGCEQLTALRAKWNVFDRERIYPSQVTQEYQACVDQSIIVERIKAAQGIFFNGGDQSKTLAAMLTPDGQPSAELRAIDAQMRAGKLIVGGTSAGTAVQAGGMYEHFPVPMLTDGVSDNVMQRGVFAYTAPSERCSSSSHCQTSLQSGDVTVRAEGGTGLFSLGLLDTHFSQRQRQTRLIASTAFAQQRWGFGVDETTALLVGFDQEKTRMRVIGEHGVFVVDLGQSQVASVRDENRYSRKIAGYAHYWLHGTNVTIQQQAMHVALPGQPVKGSSLAQHPRQVEADWWQQAQRNCGNSEAVGWLQYGNRYILQADNETQFALNEQQQCSYQHLAFAIATQ